MTALITFVIPVRHQENARDWEGVKRRLLETMSSISRQQDPGWKAVIVANYGADLPELPSGFEVSYVDFPPNRLYTQGDRAGEEFREAFRSDKGRRVLAGMLHAGDTRYFMIVDDDDFVSRRLTSFVSENCGANGWYVGDGYVWNDGGRLLYRVAEFWRVCGSCHIVRSDLFHLPSTIEAADETYLQRMLGGHVFLRGYLEAAGTPLARLPFAGAVYRSGHAESHSRSQSIFRDYFLRKQLLTAPAEAYRLVSRLKIKTRKIEREFFGA